MRKGVVKAHHHHTVSLMPQDAVSALGAHCRPADVLAVEVITSMTPCELVLRRARLIYLHAELGMSCATRYG